jgi:hypothetical protein
VRHLELTEIARADLKSIRRYSQRTWELIPKPANALPSDDEIQKLITGSLAAESKQKVADSEGCLGEQSLQFPVWPGP